MSHSVTVTRTTTTTTTSAILINTGYFKAVPGLLKLGQVILGTIIIGLVATTLSRYNNYYYSGSEELFFFVTACACLIATGCLLISCLLSISTASIISKTIFELVYHGVAFVLYLIASALAMVHSTGSNKRHDSLYLTAAILGLFNTILYLASTILAFKSYRGG
ncbi:CKLF-like MARVEL transmembrane domain-containing protein 8 isoform X2 [Neocloeon triangulifer]|uniref:CKLF-like MARVEL transmembrane domain-containing protein 8 isoform X2 n=1 Tax=Neocloeon triangulifer TaxID=2078957 RepID=UPI00286FAE76|nr:CKLF-like MARVEL transmembrane domain-containing protein 8 isoform X2 [Neocloeon triangulifer]